MRATLAIVLSPVLAMGAVLLTAPAPAVGATLGLEPVGGSPVMLAPVIVNTPSTSDTIKVTNVSTVPVKLDQMSIATTDPWLAVLTLGQLVVDGTATQVSPGDEIAAGETISAPVDVVAHSTSQRTGTLTLVDSPVGSPAQTHTATYPVLVDVDYMPSVMTLTGPASVPPDSPVTLHGTVEGDHVTAGEHVSVTRTDSAGTVAAGGGDLDATGAFTVTSSIGAGDATFEATFTDSNYSNLKEWSVHAVGTVSRLTLVGPATVPRSTKVTLSGVLTAGAQPVSGAALAITATYSNRTPVALPPVTTDAEGRYTVTDTPTWAGPAVYAASFAGDTLTSPATVSAHVTVMGRIVSMSMTTDATVYPYKGVAVIRVYLGPTSGATRTVTLSAAPYGERAVGVGARDLVGTGWAVFKFPVLKRTVFTARYIGDQFDNPRALAVVVKARGKVDNYVTGGYATSRGVRLFHRSQVPGIEATILPSQPGCLSVQSQYWTGRTWRSVKPTRCLAEKQGQWFYYYLPKASRVVGRTWRMRAVFPGNVENLGATARWVALRVTR